MYEGRPIEISPRLLGAIAEAAQADTGRMLLNMVRFDRHEISACNGHIAVRYRLERPLEEGFPAFGIARAHVETIAAATSRATALEIRACEHDKAGRVARNGKPVAVISLPQGSNLHGMQIVVPRGDVKDYPPLDAVGPKPTDEPPPPGIGYDARYLDLIYRITKYAGFGDTVRVVAWGGLRDATAFEAGPKHGYPNNEHAALRFVVMPVAPADLQAFSEALR